MTLLILGDYMSVATTPLEILMTQTYGVEDKRDFLSTYGLDSYAPPNTVRKISLNLTHEEESIINALEKLEDNFAGNNKSEIIRTLITIAFDHIKKETKDLWIPSGVTKAGHGDILLPMSLVLRNHQKAYSCTDNAEDYADVYLNLCLDQHDAMEGNK